MVSDRDIWVAANEVIKSHDDPILFAVTRERTLPAQESGLIRVEFA